MQACYCLCTFLFFIIVIANAIDISEIEEKIRNQRKTIEETARKLQESSRQQRMKHEEQLKSSRQRIEKIKNEAIQRTRERTPVIENDRKDIHNTLDEKPTETPQTPEVQDAFKKLNDFIEKEAPQLKAELDAKKGFHRNRPSATLTLHGVDDSLVEELNRMSTSSIPRDSMIQHVAQHFPDKKKEEWNDIVVAALASSGRQAPDTSDTDHALKAEARFKQEKFERSKSAFEPKPAQNQDL